MSAGQNHIIDKVFLEVNTTSEKTAYQIKNNVDYFLNNVLLSRLDELLDEYDIKNRAVRFDEIQLDLFISEWDNEREIVQEFETRLHKQMEKELYISKPSEKKSENNRQISAKQNREDVFLYFLKNGFLPWYGKESYISELIKKDNWQDVIQQKTFQEKLITLLIQHENALNRFSMQLPSEIVINYIVAVQPKKKGLEKQITSLLGVFPKDLHYQLMQIILQLSVLKEKQKIIQNLHSFFALVYRVYKEQEKTQLKKAYLNFKNFVSEYFSENKEISTVVQAVVKKYEQKKLHDELETISDTKSEKQQYETAADDSFFEEKPTEIIVQNAGLVLVHPFLKTFFTETGILTGNGNFLKEKQMLAVQALHFLAAGKEEFFEANMVFEKYLTGTPLNMPVQRESLLTDKIKAEANEMLRQVIKYWPALKNTSPDGLRQNFLQRDGKLIQNEKNYRLLVERKTQDILLEQIDWNISVVKLPWMKNLIHVEW